MSYIYGIKQFSLVDWGNAKAARAVLRTPLLPGLTTTEVANER